MILTGCKKLFITQILILFLLLSTNLLAEGTKQIMPTTSSFGELQLMPSFSNFAWFDCGVDDRLNIHIKTVGEKICFGFGDRIDNLRFILYLLPNLLSTTEFFKLTLYLHPRLFSRT